MTEVLSRAELEAAMAERPAGALAGVRAEALARFVERGFPSTRVEDWKYTDLADVEAISRRWLAAGGTTTAPDSFTDRAREAVAGIDAHWLVIGNGRLLEADAAQSLPAGASMQRLSESGAEPGYTPWLSDLNAALMHDGLHLEIAPGADIEQPIGLLLVDQPAGTATVSLPRIVIDVGAGARARFIEYHASFGGDDHYSNTVVELGIARNAEARYARIQVRDRRHSQTARLDARLARDARLHHFALDLGGKLTRNDLAVDITEPGADARFDGLYIAGNGQHIDNHTRVDHRVGPARSVQEYRGVLRGECRCVWNGKAIVYEGADGTDALQGNHNLLLAEGAEIDAKPELEIYADDVKCAHGTTVGALDEKALFYLRSRGIGETAARRILTHAFAARIVGDLPIGALTGKVTELIDDRLGDSPDMENV